jgi:uncharacterized protein YegJ (DUF2314 family)
MKPFWKVKRQSADSVVSVTATDDEMNEAIACAQASLDQFFENLANPEAGQQSFLLKVRFEINGEIEHIWLADLTVSGLEMSGTVANEPRSVDLKFMQAVSFAPAQITDWMYLENGFLVGGFTTKAIRSTLSAHERARFDAAIPYKFSS